MGMRTGGAIAVVTLVAACGRIGFDVVPADDAQPGDAPTGDGDGPTMATCASDPRYQSAPNLTSTYRVAALDRSWMDAKADCELDGAHLPIIDDDVEAASNVIGDWIDLTDAVTEGEWATSGGVPAPYLAWELGEPDGGTVENCARLEEATNVFQDRVCAELRDYSCECE